MFLKDGKPFNIDAPHTIDGVRYPAGYFRAPARRAAHGIVEAPIHPRPAERWYFVTQNPDGSFTATPKSAAMVKPIILQEINAAYQNAVDELTAGYPDHEIKSWPKQEAEARAYLADPNAPTPFIDSMLQERPLEGGKAELVSRIMAKVEAYEVAVGALTGRRHALEDRIDEIQDEADAIDTDLPNISWDEPELL